MLDSVATANRSDRLALRLVLVKRWHDRHERGVAAAVGEHTLEERGQVERIIRGEEDDSHVAPHARRTSSKRPNRCRVSSRRTRGANERRPRPCERRKRAGTIPRYSASSVALNSYGCE